MSSLSKDFDFSHLSVTERLTLIGSLWESITHDTQCDIPISEEQKRELDRRMERMENGTAEYYSWDEVKKWLLSELSKNA